MQRQRYLIIPQRELLASDFVMGILYVVMFILTTLFFAGFFYLGAEPLESEIRIEGSRRF